MRIKETNKIIKILTNMQEKIDEKINNIYWWEKSEDQIDEYDRNGNLATDDSTQKIEKEKETENTFAYRLTNTKFNSDKYGNCEVCGKYANSVYYLVQVKRYLKPDGSEAVTRRKCFDKFGHKDCLSNLTLLKE